MQHECAHNNAFHGLDTEMANVVWQRFNFIYVIASHCTLFSDNEMRSDNNKGKYFDVHLFLAFDFLSTDVNCSTVQFERGANRYAFDWLEVLASSNAVIDFDLCFTFNEIKTLDAWTLND